MNKSATHIIVIPLIFISCFSCTRSKDTFIREFDEEGLYEIQLLNGDTLCIPPHLINYYDAPMKKGMFIHYHITGDSIRDFFAVEGTGIIHSHVHEYVKDSTFMLIDQKPMDSVFGEYIRIYYNDNDYFFRRKYDTTSNSKDRWFMMENSNVHSYWIIVIKTANVYGPLTFDQYLTKKEELEVTENLKLKCER